jgi:hypothetical protein
MTENAQMGLKVWDVTVVDTLADSYVLKTSEVCKRKHSKYSSIISSNYVFKGLAFETLDPWCKEAIDFINVIGIRKGTFGNSYSSKVPLRDINFKVMFYWK